MLVVVNGALLALLQLPGTATSPLWVAAVVAVVSLALALWLVQQANRLAAMQVAASAALARQQDVFDHIDCGIVLWDASDRLVLCNREFLALYGPMADGLAIGSTFEATLRQAVARGLVPEAKGREDAWVRERLVQHAQPQAPMVRRMADGRWRRIVEQRMGDGSLLAFSIDVTEEVEQARALEQARAAAELATQRFHEAIEALPAGFELWDAEDRLVMVNSVMGELYPQVAHQLVPGRTFESLVRANFEAGGLAIADPEVDDWLRRRRAQRRGTTHSTLVHRTGQGWWIRVHERRTRDGGLVGVRFDVTELHEQQAAAEAARQAAERASDRLHDAIEVLPDGFALFDADDRLALCNERYRQIYRESAPVLEIGTRFEAILRYGVARGLYPQADGREEAWIAERMHLHRHPGPPVLQELQGNRWIRIDERLTTGGGVAGVRTEVTELVRREQQLTRLNRELDAANARLAELSDTDALTGIANRRKFDLHLVQEWARARRHALPLALLLIDVDHFKRYNDRHGHPQGDACLQRIAAVLRSTTRRAGDVVARYGGEEFALLLPHTGGEQALRHAQHCIEAIDAAALEHGDSPVGPHVTLSVGLAVSDGTPPLDSAAALLKAADTALYEAKNQGRHRAAVAH